MTACTSWSSGNDRRRVLHRHRWRRVAHEPGPLLRSARLDRRQLRAGEVRPVPGACAAARALRCEHARNAAARAGSGGMSETLHEASVEVLLEQVLNYMQSIDEQLHALGRAA